jgi:hypothetical protein
MFSWTPETRQQLTKLLSEGTSMEACAAILGCAVSTVSNAINDPQKKPKPRPKQKAKPPKQSTPRVLHSSCPLHKPVNPVHRDARQLTKPEMYNLLAAAVRNTASIASRTLRSHPGPDKTSLRQFVSRTRPRSLRRKTIN